MEIFQAIVLGVIQGLTEFLPISSSGHLVLAQQILRFGSTGLVFEVFVHFGTVLSIVVLFRDDLARILIAFFTGITHPGNWPVRWRQDADFRMTWLILLGILPAGVLGMAFETEISAAFQSPLLVGAMLIFTGLILWSSRYASQETDRIRWWQSVFIGCAQALAIIPGISRSGSTITAGLWLKIQPEQAAKFSFFLSIPVILGASFLKFFEVLGGSLTHAQIWVVIVGTVASFISGLIAIVFLMRTLRQGRFSWFALYCIGVGVLTIVLQFLLTNSS